MDSCSLLISVMLYALLCAGATVAVIYVWHLSELTGNLRARIEAHQSRWWSRLLTCPYCLGTWITLILWGVLSVNEYLPPYNLLQVIGAMFSTGAFYLLWAVFYTCWRPI